MKVSKRRCKVVLNRFKYAARCYCDETTLHGLRYVRFSRSSWLSSLLWAVVIITSACLCGILIYSQIHTYRKNRITTTIATTSYPIWNVPFPAVTVCPFNVVSEEKIEPFRAILLNETIPEHEIVDFFLNLSSLVRPRIHLDNVTRLSYEKIITTLDNAGYNTDELMWQLFEGCENILTKCFWKNEYIECNKLMKPSKTTAGFCCSFNYRGIEEDGRAGRDDNEEETDIYSGGIGSSHGLKLYVKPGQKNTYSTLKHTNGVEVVVHESDDYPDVYLHNTIAYTGSVLSLALRPRVIVSDDDIRDIDIKTRGCIFENEVEMDWAEHYSFAACLFQCKAKAIISLCNCVPFNFPIKKEMRFCTLLDSDCLERNYDQSDVSEWVDSFFVNNLSVLEQQAFGNMESCNCLPECEEVGYSYQANVQPFSAMNVDENSTIIEIYFNTISCIKIKTTIFMTWQGILASIGGLFGLCLGGSIMSIFELFYYIVKTIFSNYKQQHEPKLYWTDFYIAKNVIIKSELIRQKNVEKT